MFLNKTYLGEIGIFGEVTKYCVEAICPTLPHFFAYTSEGMEFAATQGDQRLADEYNNLIMRRFDTLKDALHDIAYGQGHIDIDALRLTAKQALETLE